MSEVTFKTVGWKPVVMTLTDWRQAVKRMRHLETTLDLEADDACLGGYAVWMTEYFNSQIGICWQWREACENVPAISNPMAISCNVIFVDSAYSNLPLSKRAIILNTAVYRLPWKEQVLREERVFIRTAERMNPMLHS